MNKLLKQYGWIGLVLAILFIGSENYENSRKIRELGAPVQQKVVGKTCNGLHFWYYFEVEEFYDQNGHLPKPYEIPSFLQALKNDQHCDRSKWPQPWRDFDFTPYLD